MVRPWSAPTADARLRGGAVAALTVLLATAAHGAAAGAVPAGGAIGLLMVLAAGLGAMVTASPRARGPVPLIGLLAAGQLAGHLVLGAGTAHQHPGHPGAMSGALMFGGHVAAVLAGGILVAAAERFAAALSRVVRNCSPNPFHRIEIPGTTVLPAAEHPLLRSLLVAASISHRGPPALPAC